MWSDMHAKVCFTGEPNDFVPQAYTVGDMANDEGRRVDVPTDDPSDQEMFNNLAQESCSLLTCIAKLICPSLIGSIAGGVAGAVVAGPTLPAIGIGAAIGAGAGGVITLLFKLFGSNSAPPQKSD